MKITRKGNAYAALKSAGDPKRMAAALYKVGQNIELDAERSITQGSVSGTNHVPSAPGEPPNADTRFLDSNIETTIEAQTQSDIRVHVTSHAPYSAALEYGTSKMAERPFMRPAVEKNRKKLAEEVGQAVKIGLRSK